MRGDRILTSDQRLRIYVSSTLTELAAERAAARDAIQRLRLRPIMVEPAAVLQPSREVYRSSLAHSDVFVGIYGEHSWIPPGETISSVEDEFDVAGDMPRLLYVKQPVDGRDERLTALIDRIERSDTASHKTFATADELGELIANDLALLLSERFPGDADTGERAALDRSQPPRLPVPPDAFVGRAADVAAVAELLRRQSERLITLVGPGGIGKTRLALEAARHAGDAFPGGMVFVPLSAVGDPTLVVGAIADALGARREAGHGLLEAVGRVIGDQRTLLILDNFEQVLDAAAAVLDLLEQARSAVVLVTSRHVLQVRLEHQYQVAPLPEPDGVALFVARAAAVRPGFSLTDEDTVAVAEICRRLDGLPLAIELAAARVRLLPPTVLLSKLGERLDVAQGAVDLPERQRTLRATMDWSYNLLSPQEQTVFARLAVFVGGWTLDAAEAVCGRSDEPALLDTLDGLLASSLLTDADGGEAEPRFTMLETVRSYARDRLATSPDRGETQRRHTEWMLAVTAERLQVQGPGHQVWLERFGRERGNLRSVVRRALDADDVATVARLARDAFVPLAHRDAEAEVIEWLDEALARGKGAAGPVRGRLLVVRALTAAIYGEYGRARALLTEGATLLPDDAAHAYDHALTAAAEVYWAMAEDPARAATLIDAASGRLAALGERLGQAYMEVTAGHLALLHDDIRTAEQRYGSVVGIAGDLGDDAMRGRAQSLFGLTLLARGDVDGARLAVVAGAAANRRGGQPTSMAYSLDGLAAVALASGRPATAARALAAAAAIRDQAGNPASPAFVPLLKDLVARSRAALGDEPYEAAVAEAEQWDAVEAVDRTLDDLQAPPRDGTPGDPARVTRGADPSSGGR